MPITYKVLGQTGTGGNFGNGAATLVANTATNLYTVPSLTSAIISTINICNQSTGPDTVSVAVRPGGSALSNQQYICFLENLAPLSTMSLTLGATLAAGDIITVLSTNGTSSFSAFGSEIS